MKSKGIKNKIILNFFVSGVQAFFITFLIFIIFFGSMQILSYSIYTVLLDKYNNDYLFMMLYSFVVFCIFIFFMYTLFSKKMNKMINYIDEISKVLKEIAKGNMDINIPIKSNDELGELASNVNKMAGDLSILIDKERQWDNQRNNLIMNLSHDLRTPLTSILGFLNIIKDETKSNENLNHYCEVALNKANELKKSINQLFEFTKISNSDLKLNLKEISLQEMIEQVLISFIPEMESNKMKYRILSNNRSLTIKADPNLLMRAFENIITNTIKYASEGKYIDINIKDKDTYTSVIFTNYGPVINEEELKNLFDKYYRCKKTCDKKEGTGLGMSIVKAIMDLHGGSISVNSNEEKTEFILNFMKK